MPFQCADQLSGRHVPQLDRVVFIAAGRGQEGSVGWRERHRTDLNRMPFEGADQLASSHVPESDGGIRRERHRSDSTPVPFQRPDQFPGPHVPQLDRAIPRPRSQNGAVGRQRHGGQRPMTGEPGGMARLHVPQQHREVYPVNWTEIGLVQASISRCKGAVLPPGARIAAQPPGQASKPGAWG